MQHVGCFKKNIITRPLDVWIKKTREERGFGGGKSLILERIPTLSHSFSFFSFFFFFFFFLKNTKTLFTIMNDNLCVRDGEHGREKTTRGY